MNRLAAFALSFMAACAPVPQDAPPSRATTLVTDLPPAKSFSGSYAAPVRRANAEIVQDFLDLSFRMESGKAIPVMTRFEGPISVRIAGPAPASLGRDLQYLLGRFRSEAGIDIMLTDSANAQIVVEAIPQATLQRAVPRAACFVVPRIASWEGFLVARRTQQVDWTTLTKRDRAVIFVPADAAPQEVRDCLHEELAQALGPLNDLYRLPDSVFNDDNIHTVLTGFDMLILRAYYAPELRNGMTRAQVAAILPGVMARLNPQGDRIPAKLENDTTREWIDAMELALTSGSTPARRRTAAQEAIQLGQRLGWSGTREGFAYYAYGRLQVGNDSESALSAFNAAEAIYRQSPTTQIHAAHIAVQKSAFALRSGDAQAVLGLTEAAIPVAMQHQNAALLSTLMMFKAEALDMIGNTVASQEVRLDSLGWARYGFGADANVQARLAEISALRPF
ncbi:Protein of unknown function [Cognatiyoonia koreensis]|uniref:DUF2927 domain-containing protein n=1 Tax=Cognatiyoonia koreensis TaxID=364200 RepID=A0A1I0NV94_9RHOB|nr:DUF2927 domain-containing protein [Cognatiyoonia koreensis]SEW05661.1 Protein of unknown function [Cognatiyoonia koreensis]